MKIKNLLFVGIAAAALFAGCKKDEVTDAAISISPTSLEFAQGGETKTITVTANRDWVVQIPDNASWVTVEPASGSASDEPVTVTVKADPNTDITRYADITFSATITSAVLEIAQAGAPMTITSIADFKAKTPNTTDWYFLQGTITEISNDTYGNLTLSDATGTIDVRGVTATQQTDGNDKSFSTLGLEVGDILTIRAIVGEYNGTIQAGTNSIPTCYIEHTPAGDIEAVELASIDEVFTTSETKVIVKGQVIAVSSVSFVLNDGGKNLLVYASAEPGVEVGDNVSVTGTVSDYGGLTQLTDPEVSDITETFTVATQTPTSLSGETLASYNVEDSPLVTVEAAVAVSNGYTNLLFDNGGGIGTLVESSLDSKFEDGNIMTVTGYYAGRNGRGYFCIIPTEAEVCSNNHIFVFNASDPTVEIEDQVVTSGSGEYSFRIIANCAWTVDVAGEGFSVDNASGSTNATVKVTYTENTTSAEREATVTVSGNSQTFTIKFTQNAPLSGDAQFVKITGVQDDYSGVYLIAFDDFSVVYDGSRTSVFNGAQGNVNNKEVTISNGAIVATDETMSYSVTIEKSGDGYTIKTNSGYYLHNNGSTSNGLHGTTDFSDKCVNTIEWDAENKGFVITAVGGKILLYNSQSNSHYVRFYTASNISNDNYDIPQLYKFEE